MHPLIQFSTPDSLPDTRPFGFSQIASIHGGRLAMISGQVGWDTNYQIVSDDIGEQTQKVFQNITACLEELNATPKDVVKLNLFIVDYDQQTYNEKVSPHLQAFVDPKAPPLMTLLGVAHLARPDFRIEIEAIVVLPIEKE